jgi:hypothetical protein
MGGQKVIHVLGEGGSVFAMALPLPKPVQQRLDKGYLRRVNADGTPYDERHQADTGSDLTNGVPARPSVNAPKADWVAYAVGALGLSAEQADGATKKDLIDLAAASRATANEPNGEGEQAGSDLTTGVPPRPPVDAPKADWVGYAVHALGLTPDDAEAATKQDLIDLAGSPS